MTTIAWENGGPVMKNGAIGESPCGCCGAGDQSPCTCFGTAWPTSFTANFCGFIDFPIAGRGKCNCPLDGYAAGFNQTVVLDYAGEINPTTCPALFPSGTRDLVFGIGVGVSSGGVSTPNAVGVFRGTMTNGTCDEYGVELLAWKQSDTPDVCFVRIGVDKLAAGTPGICDPWCLATMTCNSWWFDGQLSSGCMTSDMGGVFPFPANTIYGAGVYQADYDPNAQCTLEATL